MPHQCGTVRSNVHVNASYRILRRPEVKAKTGKGTSQIYADMAAGKFPRPVRLGPQSVGWLEHEVDAWIAERIAERDATAAS